VEEEAEWNPQQCCRGDKFPSPPGSSPIVQPLTKSLYRQSYDGFLLDEINSYSYNMFNTKEFHIQIGRALPERVW
jgi:hypothetical protein